MRHKHKIIEYIYVKGTRINGKFCEICSKDLNWKPKKTYNEELFEEWANK